MRKRTNPMRLFSAAFALSCLCLLHTSIAEAQSAPVATQNGDVNGDDRIDLGDAIYLLNWQFLDGPKPVEFGCPGPFAETLAAIVDQLDDGGGGSGGGVSMSAADVHPFYAPGAVVGSSHLLRNGSGVTSTLHTTDVLPGHAFTLWWVVFNNPAACVDGCNGPDLRNPEVMADVMYATGNISGDAGTLNFGAHLSVGDTSGSIIDDLFGLEPIGLIDPMGAEIHQIIRSHGPAIPGQVSEQITTFNGGCTIILPRPEIPDEEGECVDIQFAVHS